MRVTTKKRKTSSLERKKKRLMETRTICRQELLRQILTASLTKIYKPKMNLSKAKIKKILRKMPC